MVTKRKSGSSGVSESAKRTEVTARILENRNAAHRMANRIVHSMGAFLSEDELTSAADYALCEAASRYRPVPQATFTTYLFYFLKGEVVKALNNTALATIVFNENSTFNCESEEEGNEEIESVPSDTEATCPEKLTYRTQLKLVCSNALRSLSSVEQKVIVDSHVREDSMDVIASRLGYSRGHLFAIRKIAERKMRHHFSDFDLAA